MLPERKSASVAGPGLVPSALAQPHAVRSVRETLRRWWGIELGFAGSPAEIAPKSIAISPENRICTACLHDEEGGRRCVASIREAVLAGGSGLAGPCHLGLDVVVARLSTGGVLFGCGFVAEKRSADARESAVRGAARLRLPVADPPRAFEGIPRLEERDVPRLVDLVGTAASEMVAFSGGAPSRHNGTREATVPRRQLFADIVGKSAPMQGLYALLDKLVKSDITVLVTGENGTGKELIARALHRTGLRKDKTFVAQNCSALNDNLLESELFGHVKGSFTGATRDKIGLFKLADGGTLFLDEVGDMSPSMQVKLLRVLQEGTFLPVGAEKPEQVDVRIIAATNRDLREMVVHKEFREDLFYRLHVVNVEVPALRERIEDLPLLCEHFLGRIAARGRQPKKRLHPDLLRSFYEARWAGNVRELENELERLVVLAGEAEVIPPELRSQARPDRGSRSNGAGPASTAPASCDLATAVGRVERDLIAKGLRELGGNKSRLAARLGVSRTTLIKKIREYAIEEARAEGEQGEAE
ncbi:MAG: AAA family ATPase [Deltaproteobacteria bacterium]|nr:MAG: AAA family ATPase [Deltaproteobacteria bacterium]TMB34262.1 MAG: AAA family ATPase [Deltaproteobacteria bacterium]